jgi:hypothetical protein
VTGFEPATSGSTIRRSNQLSYTHQLEGDSEMLGRGTGILAKGKERPQAGFVALRYPRASNAICISARIAETATAGSVASLMGRPMTR